MPEVIATRSQPRRSIVGADMNAQNSVRVYRQSPEDVLLQIRRTRDYTSVSLTFDEAWDLVDALIDALPHREAGYVVET